MTDTNIRNAVAGNAAFASGASSATVNLPSGLTAGDPLRVYVASGLGTSQATAGAPTGWTFEKAQTTMGTASFFVLDRTGGWQSGDGTSLAIPISPASSSAGSYAYVSVALNQGNASGWGTDGTYTVKGTSSTTTTTAPVTSADTDRMVAFFGKMSSNNGSPSVTGGAVVIASDQETSASSPNIWVGSYTQTGGGAGTTQTITYSASTGNGASVEIPINPAGTNPTAVVTVTDLNDKTITYNTTGTASTNSGQSIASYDLDWGDGTTHGTSASGTHAYGANGNYTVTLTATDTLSFSSSASFAVQVASGLGTASAGIVALGSGWTQTPSTGATPQQVLNDASGTTFLSSPTNPSSSVQTIRMQKLSWSSGQTVAFALALDETGGTTGSVTVALVEGVTTRATVSGLTPVIVTVGSSVTNVVGGTFTAAQMAAVTDLGNCSLVATVTAS